MPTKADLTTRDLSKFQIVSPEEFVFNHRTSRNGSKFSIAFNDTGKPIICTEDYVVFRISDYGRMFIVPEWLYMFFNRPEFDRFVITNSWGSSTEFYNWEDICDVDMALSPLSVQQKYVDIYNSMLANQRCYERGLEDLQVICDAHFDRAKKERTIQLREVLERVNVRNADGSLGEGSVRGISNKKEFSNTKADVANKDLSKFIVVKKGEFAFNTRTDGRDMLVLALNREERPIIVTWNYNAFRIRSDALSTIIPEYLYSFLKRSEFDRRVRFMSWGSTQELFSWDSLCDVYVPIPPIEVQRSIANITEVFTARKSINERLKAQIKDLCPILVKGAVEEGEIYE